MPLAHHGLIGLRHHLPIRPLALLGSVRFCAIAVGTAGPLAVKALEGLDLFLNEEGKLNGLSYNPKATLLTAILMHGDVIVGDTFVCAHDGEGRSVGLSDAQELALSRRLRELGV